MTGQVLTDTRAVPHPTPETPGVADSASPPEVPAPRHEAPSGGLSPRAARLALACLLGGTAVLYLWGLGASGWANAYYSAAAQAGSQSWTAFLFGSFDAGNAITVDKPPASLWPMALSVRIFGLSSWSILVPQALMGVASVALLYATVRRWASVEAGLLAGLVMALTPVAALIFRFNNPDALLVLLMITAVYAVQRGIDGAATRAGTWWFVLAGAALGFGFLTKMLQAFLVVPALVGVVLLAAPTGMWRRIRLVAVMGAATVVSAGWWVALVELTPADQRPYVGGSQTNSVLELMLGYNGVGRLTGEEVGSVTGGGPGGSIWGATGWDRVFSASWAGQASWLLPSALVLLAAGLWATRRAARTDRTRASLLVWGGWLVVTALVFSFAQGIIHEYYSVALAPAIAALVGIGAALLWSRRSDWRSRATLAAAGATAAVWAAVLLGRSPDWNPWLVPLVLGLGLGGAAVLLTPWRGWYAWAAAASLVGVLLGPAAWAVQTAATPHTGSLPLAGPTAAARAGAPGAGGGPLGGPPAAGGRGFQGLPGAPGQTVPGQTVPGQSRRVRARRVRRCRARPARAPAERAVSSTPPPPARSLLRCWSRTRRTTRG